MSQSRLSDKLFIIVQHCLPQHLLSRLIGYLAETKISWLKNCLIRQFVGHFNVDMQEAERTDIESYINFNDFFTRALKTGARPIAGDMQGIISPADGAVSEAGTIENNTLIQAKGRSYKLTDLLGGNKALAEQFSNGSFATIYLSPRDYHRVHMPLDGKLLKTMYVPGKLFSVNQTTVDAVPDLFARNERLVCIFDSPAGPMAVILVGAMIVAGIETVWGGQVTPKPRQPISIDYPTAINLQKGDEMGRFKLGSTVIVLFAKDAAGWQADASPAATLQMGQLIGHIAAS